MLINDATNPARVNSAPERLTWDQICQRYPDEWVVVVDIESMDETGADEVSIEFCSAVVVAHHKTRKEASPSVKAMFKHYDEVGSFFTGRLLPAGFELLPP